MDDSLQTLAREENAHCSSAADAFSALLAGLEQGLRVVTVTGVRGAGRGYLLAQLGKKGLSPVVCVTADEEQADELANDLAFFLGQGPSHSPRVLRLPAGEQLPYDALSPDRRAIQHRLATLFHLRQGTDAVALVLSARALLRRQLPPPTIDRASCFLRTNQDLDRDLLVRQLLAMGYQGAPVVEDAGTFAVHGGMVDVWSPIYDQPARIEFFGDTIENMRLFAADTQRTVAALDKLALCPANEVLFNDQSKSSAVEAIREVADAVNRPSSKVRELLDSIAQDRLTYGIEALLPGFYENKLASIFDYFSRRWEKPLFFLDDFSAVAQQMGELGAKLQAEFESARLRQELAFAPQAHFLEHGQALELIKQQQALFNRPGNVGALGEKAIGFHFSAASSIRQEIVAHHGEQGALTPLVQRVIQWHDQGVVTAVACGTSGQIDRLKGLLANYQMPVSIHAVPLDVTALGVEPEPRIRLYAGEISQGLIDTPGGLALLGEEDIFGQRARKIVRRPRAELPLITAFRDLKEGDLVVHADYGIGRYCGLSKMTLRGIGADVMIIEYAGKDKVYLPVHRMRLVQKFNGADAQSVTLDRLGSASWERRKKAVKEHLLKMAAQLLNLYAARKAHPGHGFSAPDDYFRQFESEFAFEETPDQAKAIEDVLADMQSERPMDRLICGDVGYGKTEVALRAAFKAVLDKKQVAVLVPTTVLAAQHLRTFRERFRDFPVNVDSVSRMRTAKEIRETLHRAAQGAVDIVIGTHRLLGSDVSFKNLGLLVIDEEQRFGVAHKERLKQYRSQVDVLTMTATPIPRTLHMSMSGVRDMSIIASAPQDRKAIRTLVLKFNPMQISEAINREIARGGQVFFVHNRVETIGQMERFLRELLPQARFAVAHGQMPHGKLEKVMTEFVEHRYDVLIASSIIESGLDIPAANTIIVNRADMFGLAQLYQIRGRVGRSKERAYAYLLVPERTPISEDANRRLEVLANINELGAGFAIASHDLEIRGAGNLLGPDQSGQIAAVGFDLYAQLLDQAVRELRGEKPNEIIDPEVNLPIPAFIPDDYVPDIHLRLLFYKRFSQVQNDDELSDLRGELVDRFGDLPVEVDNLSHLMALKADMRRLRLRVLDSGPGRLVCSLGNEALIDIEKLAKLVQRARGRYRLTPQMKLLVTVDSPKSQNAQGFLLAAKHLLSDLFECESS